MIKVCKKKKIKIEIDKSLKRLKEVERVEWEISYNCLKFFSIRDLWEFVSGKKKMRNGFFSIYENRLKCQKNKTAKS